MKRSVVRAQRVPSEAPNAARGAIWRSRKQSTDFPARRSRNQRRWGETPSSLLLGRVELSGCGGSTESRPTDHKSSPSARILRHCNTDWPDCPEKSEAASSRRTPAGPRAAHLEDRPSWSQAMMGGQSPSWTARAGGGPVFLPEIIYARFSKRTQMTAPGKTGKHRFPEGIRVFRSPGTRESKSFFTKRSQMKSDCRLVPGLRKPSPLPAPSAAFGVPVSAGLRPSRRSGQTPVQVSPSQSEPVQVKPAHKKIRPDPTRPG